MVGDHMGIPRTVVFLLLFWCSFLVAFLMMEGRAFLISSYCSGRFATMTYIQDYLPPGRDQLMKPPVLTSVERKQRKFVTS
jgi:hypothetical protein